MNDVRTIAGEITISNQLLGRTIDFDAIIRLEIELGYYQTATHKLTRCYKRHGTFWCRCSCGWAAERMVTRHHGKVAARDHLVEHYSS